jgi:hypothetical protein
VVSLAQQLRDDGGSFRDASVTGITLRELFLSANNGRDDRSSTRRTQPFAGCGALNEQNAAGLEVPKVHGFWGEIKELSEVTRRTPLPRRNVGLYVVEFDGRFLIPIRTRSSIF